LIHIVSLYSCRPYACESYELTEADMARINVAWNSVFQKIFKVNDVNIINDIIDYGVVCLFLWKWT